MKDDYWMSDSDDSLELSDESLRKVIYDTSKSLAYSNDEYRESSD